MEKIIVNGGKPLKGTVGISGMKNAALPILFACVLINDKCVIENLPQIKDVELALEILKSMNIKVTKLGADAVEIDSSNERYGTASSELVRKMRASYYLLGAELGQFGETHLSYPGGCDFGVRPIDQHIKGFEALGAEVSMDELYVDIKAPEGLKGTSIFFDVVSVGATMNVMLAAVKAEGVTVIENAAREPHIVDLANFLNTCGAKVSGAGTDTIKIKGTKELHGCTYAIIPDMIEAGTFMVAAAATGGDVVINNVIPRHLESLSAKMEEMGINVEELDDAVRVSCNGELKNIKVKTMPYPGFPTDMQPQICVLMCLANGISFLSEGIWDSRFKYIGELKRMGADIKIDGKTAIISGGTALRPAIVRAVDLRAGAAMVIAGLATKGQTEIEDIYYIERGYDDIVGKFAALGADIKKVVI